MPDIAVNLEAADVLGLAGNFEAQGSTITTSASRAEVLKANGDICQLSAEFGLIDNGTIAYGFCENSGLGAALVNIGSVQNGYLITSMSADTDKEAYTVINYTFHNHTNNAHAAGNEYAVPADMKAILTGAYGAYDFAGKASATVAIQSSNYTLEVTHTDDDDHQGNHWVGTSTRGVETYNCQYSGNIATPTTPAAGWTLIETAITDGNTVHDNSTQNAERLVLRV